MEKQKLGRKLLLGFVSILLLLLLFVPNACTMTGDAEVIEGILQNIDDIKGEITILTEDGQEITIKITSDDTENGQSGEGGRRYATSRQYDRSGPPRRSRQTTGPSLAGGCSGSLTRLSSATRTSRECVWSERVGTLARTEFVSDLPGQLGSQGGG